MSEEWIGAEDEDGNVMVMKKDNSGGGQRNEPSAMGDERGCSVCMLTNMAFIVW